MNLRLGNFFGPLSLLTKLFLMIKKVLALQCNLLTLWWPFYFANDAKTSFSRRHVFRNAVERNVPNVNQHLVGSCRFDDCFSLMTTATVMMLFDISFRPQQAAVALIIFRVQTELPIWQKTRTTRTAAQSLGNVQTLSNNTSSSSFVRSNEWFATIISVHDRQ